MHPNISVCVCVLGACDFMRVNARRELGMCKIENLGKTLSRMNAVKGEQSSRMVSDYLHMIHVCFFICLAASTFPVRSTCAPWNILKADAFLLQCNLAEIIVHLVVQISYTCITSCLCTHILYARSINLHLILFLCLFPGSYENLCSIWSTALMRAKNGCGLARVNSFQFITLRHCGSVSISQNASMVGSLSIDGGEGTIFSSYIITFSMQQFSMNALKRWKWVSNAKIECARQNRWQN